MKFLIFSLISAVNLLLWIVLGVKAYFSMDHKYRGFSIFVMILSFILNSIIKYKTKKKRPIDFPKIFGVQRYSFPSAHTQLSFTALALIQLFSPSLFVYALILSLATAAVRILFQRHWIRDVFFGALIGYAFGISLGFLCIASSVER